MRSSQPYYILHGPIRDRGPGCHVLHHRKDELQFLIPFEKESKMKQY